MGYDIPSVQKPFQCEIPCFTIKIIKFGRTLVAYKPIISNLQVDLLNPGVHIHENRHQPQRNYRVIALSSGGFAEVPVRKIWETAHFTWAGCGTVRL